MEIFSSQRTAFDLMGKLLIENRPVALGLVGAKGVGKTSLAALWVQRHFCQYKNACGECLSCRMLSGGYHPDLLLVKPEGQSILIGQIKEALDKIELHPAMAPVKVVLIKEAEKLRMEAANALLKTLEEPSSTVKIILVVHQPALLLPTISSRLLKIQFPYLGSQDQTSILRSKGWPEEKINAYLAYQLGRIDPVVLENFALFQNWQRDLPPKLLSYLNSAGADLWVWQESIAKEGLHRVFCLFFAHFLQCLLKLKLFLPVPAWLDEEIRAELLNRIGLPALFNSIELVMHCWQTIELNAGKDMALEAMLIKWKRLVSGSYTYSA